MAWLTTAEALAALGVRPQTLYANVSRGRITAKPDPRDPRRSLYNARDVARVANKRATGRKAEAVAADAIGWGEPILPSAVSTVVRGRLFYRGQDVVRLAESASLEEVAALLWNADAALFTRARRPALRVPQAATAHERMFLAVAQRAATDQPAHGRALAVLHEEGTAVLDTLIGALLDDSVLRGHHVSIHDRIARAWRPRGGEKATAAIRRALVLLADHELNASTFAARVTASTGASLAASVLAGLSALSGPLHGGAAASLRALIARATRAGAEPALREWLAQGRPIAGFGHPLYPDGDVRAQAILQGIRLSPSLDALCLDAERIVGERPNVDFALAALAATFRLPEDAPFVLFATARAVGWIAHALEQATTGRLIRPRARYVGPPVQTSAQTSAQAAVRPR
jgi:citrate synthase